MSSTSRPSTVLLSIASMFIAQKNANGATHRFEPTDLQFENAGTAEFDMQYGVARAYGRGTRAVIPDLEFQLGLLANVELEIDGALSLDNALLSSATWVGDPLWVSAKLGIYGTGDFSVGLQLGPRLPTLQTGKGIGYGALGLFGFTKGPVHLVFNGGGLVDPGDDVARGRPTSVVLGIDLDFDLDDRDRWSLLGELASAFYASDDPNELSGTIGIQLSPTRHLDLSVVALGGVLRGGDQAAILLGVSPKFDLF